MTVQSVLDDAIVALTLMIEESKPDEKDMIVKVIGNLIIRKIDRLKKLLLECNLKTVKLMSSIKNISVFFGREVNLPI